MKRWIQKTVSLLAVTAMLLTVIPFGVTAEDAVDPGFILPEGYTLQAIGTETELAAVATGAAAQKIYYYLTGDIEIASASFGIGSNESTDAFWDILDGNGFAVILSGPDGEGVAMNGNGTWNGGLFFALNGDAVIKNLTIRGKMTSTAQSTGALVGNMVNGTLDRCVNYADVTASGKEAVGGLAGRLKEGIVANCMNYGAVTGGNLTGGVVGKASYGTKGVNAAIIANCANFGSVTGKEKVGGIIGLADKDKTYTVENCYNTGTVTGTTTATQGGIVCANWPNAVTVVNCYALDTSAKKFLNVTTKLTEEQMTAQEFADTLNANVTAGITFANGVSGSDIPLSLVAWQYNAGGYPTIPMAASLLPPEDVPPEELTPEEAMAVIRQRLVMYFLKNDSVHSSGAHNGICYVSEAGDYLALQNEDGSWSDVDYYCTQSAANGGVWEPYLALDRMLAMSYAWAKEGGEWYHSDEMAQGVNKAFTYWASIKDANPDDPSWVGPWSTNWWENSNGVQRRFGPIGVVMKEGLTGDSIDVILKKLNKDGSTESGENALWNTQNALYRALTAGDAVQLRKVVDNNLAVNLRVGGLTDEAIQVDNTFHCHGYQLYTNGYGKSLFCDMALWIDLLAGTEFAMPQHVLDLMADYMLGGTRWMIRGDLLEMADGYKGGGASGYIEALQQMIKNDPQNAAEYQKVLDSITGASGTTYNGSNGNNYMWTSALMAHQREGYGVNVRMNMKGMKSTEWRATWPNTDFGNLIFWTADATATVMIYGDEYMSVYNTYDWRHIPGVTAPFALAKHYGFDNDSNDCWGVTDGTYGAAAYTFNKHDGTNKRTWGKIGYFFFDNEYVALGAGIGSNHAQAIHTTLNQTKAAAVAVNGEAVADGTDDRVYQAEYVYNNGIGYVFPQSTEVHLSNLNQTSKKYPTVRGNGYSNLDEDRFGETDESTFSLWLDHGVAPADETYAYIVVPNTTNEALAAYKANSQIIIVANTKTVQAVRHEGLKQTQINFYEAGSLEYAEGKTVTVDGPCSLIVDESGETVMISEAVSNMLSAHVVNVVLETAGSSTTTLFCSADEPYAGKSITLAEGSNSLVQSSAFAPGHDVDKAFDKNLITYWEGTAAPSWISYDMQEILYLGSMTIRWGEEYATKYELQYSENGADWETVYAAENGQGGIETIPYNVIGRFWRLLLNESSGDTYQINEITFQPSRDIAHGKTATASAEQKPAANAVDGDNSTRWVGEKGRRDGWIAIDLGMASRLDGVRVIWEASYATKYTIDVSNDGVTWETVETVEYTAPDGSKILPVQTALPQGTVGRYLRVKGVEMALNQYGLSIWEIEVYGEAILSSDNVAAGKDVIDSSSSILSAVTDANNDTFWNSSNATDTLTLDLGETYQVESTSITWGERYATQYVWQVSLDGVAWSDVTAVTQGGGTAETAVISTNCRYLRLALNESSGDGYDVAEWEVYGIAIKDMNPDKSALEQAIARQVRSDVYTKNSYAAYTEALAMARNVYTNDKATKKQVDEALSALNAAYAGLAFRNFGEVLATVKGETSTAGDRKTLQMNWKALDKTLDLSKEDLNEIYLFATIDIETENDSTGKFTNGRILLRSPDTAKEGGGTQENNAWVNTNTLIKQDGRTVLYFPLSQMTNQTGTMDWSQIKTFRYYIDSLNNLEGSKTAILSDVQIIRTSEPAKVKVACVGDSITAGSGASGTDKNYVSLLQRLLGEQYIVQNFGNGGKTLLKEDANAYTLTDTYRNSVAFEPDVVIVMLGTNDSKDAVWTAYGDKFEQELRELVQVYRDLSSKPIVILATSPTAYNRNWTINDEVITNEIAPIQRTVAAEMDCPLIEINANTKDMAGNYADGIHPNDNGYTVLADLFAKGVTDAATRIYEFELAGRKGSIDHTAKTITLQLPADADLTALEPTIKTMLSATVSLQGVTDFSAPVTVTVTAPDQTNMRDYVVTVTKEAPPAPGPLTFTDNDGFDIPSGMVGTALEPTIDVSIAVSGGTAPYTYSLENAPNWLSIDTAGVISGTRPATAASASTATVRVTDQASASKTITIAVGEVTAASPSQLLLQNAIAEAEATSDKQYAPNAKAKLDTALAAAEAAVNDVSIAPETLNELAEALTQAIAELRLLGDTDLDGQITSTDARMALQAAVGKITLDETQRDCANVDYSTDAKVTSTDARLILQYAVQKIPSFPA